MDKTCPNCNKTFKCEGENDCWCESAKIHKKDLIIIMKKYDDCLCPDCLTYYEEK